MLKTKKRYLYCLLLLIIVTITSFFQVGAEEQQGDYLKYQEPQVATSTSWLSTFAYVLSLLATFAVVIGLAYFTSRFLGQKMTNISASGSNKIVTALPLGPNRFVYVVEIAGSYLVLGVTDHTITLLKELTTDEEIEKIRGQELIYSDVNQSNSTFQRHLASLQKMSQKFPTVFDAHKQDNEREKR